MTGDHHRYAGAVRRMIRGLGRRVGNADPEDMAELLVLREEVEQAIAAAVAGQRARGCSWTEVARGLQVSRQAAQMRYGGRQTG